MLQFHRLPPHPALRNDLQGYRLIEAGDAPTTLDLVPDGFPELAFPLRHSIKMAAAGKTPEPLVSPSLMGQTTGIFTILPEPGSKLLLVKMYPWTPFRLFGTPAFLLKDEVTELAGLSDEPSFRQLATDLASVTDFRSAADLLDLYFLKKTGALPAGNAFLESSVRQIYRKNGALDLDDLTSLTHASRRYVEKVFKHHVGISPKHYARLIRVKKASILLMDPRFDGVIGRIADSLDYFDSSHFVKDFRNITGLTPSGFLRRNAHLMMNDEC